MTRISVPRDAEAAKDIALSLSPFRRRRQVAECITAMVDHVDWMGWETSDYPNTRKIVLGRSALISASEQYDNDCDSWERDMAELRYDLRHVTNPAIRAERFEEEINSIREMHRSYRSN